MRCWHCGAVPNIPSKSERVVCVCGKNLGVLNPTPEPTPDKNSALIAPRDFSQPSLSMAAFCEEPRAAVAANPYIGSILILLIGVALAGYGGYSYLQGEQFAATMLRAQGHVVELDLRGKPTRNANATVQFVAHDGKTYTTYHSVVRSTRIGARLDVLYVRENPNLNRDASVGSASAATWTFGGLGLTLILFGLFMLSREMTAQSKFKAEKAQDLANFGSAFPPVCAACAQAAPVGTWPVYGPTTTINGPAAVVHNTPFVEVPVCSPCRLRLYLLHATAWIAGIVVAAVVFGLVYFQAGDPSDHLPWAILGGLLAGGFTVAIAQKIVGHFASLGAFVPETNEVHFKCPGYQELHNQYLAQANLPYSQAAGALEARFR